MAVSPAQIISLTQIGKSGHPELHNQNFYGFSVGGHDYVMTGGIYHNGVAAHHENCPERELLGAEGGEPARGYVNISNNHLVYYFDVAYLLLTPSVSVRGQIIDSGRQWIEGKSGICRTSRSAALEGSTDRDYRGS